MSSVSVSVLDSRWHRVLAGYADLVKLCGMTVLLCLGVVTIPVALATAYAGVRYLLRTGDLPPSGRVVREVWRPATATGLPALLVAAASAVAAVQTTSPFLISAALVSAALAMVLLVRTAATISRDPQANVSTAWHLVLRDLALHPAASGLLVVPWIVVTSVLLLAPVAVTVLLWCVALTLPPIVGLALTERRSRTHVCPSATLTERSLP